MAQPGYHSWGQSSAPYPTPWHPARERAHLPPSPGTRQNDAQQHFSRTGCSMVLADARRLLIAAMIVDLPASANASIGLRSRRSAFYPQCAAAHWHMCSLNHTLLSPTTSRRTSCTTSCTTSRTTTPPPPPPEQLTALPVRLQMCALCARCAVCRRPSRLCRRSLLYGQCLWP